MIHNRISEKQELLNLINYFFAKSPEIQSTSDGLPKEKLFEIEYDEIKLAILSSLENFLRASDSEELSFPASFSTSDQRLVQIAADRLGLKTRIVKKSKNQSSIVVYKTDIKAFFREPVLLNVTWNSRRSILQFLNSNPFTIKEKQEIHHKAEKDIREDRHRGTTGKLMDAVPQVPLMKMNECNVNVSPDSAFIPIWSMKNEIIEAVSHNPIVIIFSAAGCGKTTQIGQIIMQECAKSGEPCRMICTQPYRLTAHANAQFVTQQRKENIGQTVGYQIRLESKVSPRTLLTFCTNEVLLRTLYGDRGFLNGTTHIIVDEVQERCKHSDLLLCVLNKMQKIHRHIKIIILISTPALPYDIVQTPSPWTKNSYYSRHYNHNGKASKDMQNNHLVNTIRQYFDYCPTIYVRKPVQDIEELFLEDILNIVDYQMDNTDKSKSLYKVDLFKLTFEKWFSCWACRSKPNGNVDLTIFEIFYKSTNPNLYSGNLMNYDLSGIPNIGMVNSNYSNQPGNIICNNQVDYVSLYDDILWSVWSRPDIEDITSDMDIDSENFDVSKCTNYHILSMKAETGINRHNYFKFLFSIIANQFVSVNHQHRMSGLSVLMICSFRGFKNVVSRLLSLGANVTIPLVVMENVFQAFRLYLNHLQNTEQINKNIEFYYHILSACHNGFAGSNIIYASDLAIMTRNFEILDLLFRRLACLAENMNLRSISSNLNRIPSSKPIPFVENFDCLYNLIKALLKTIDKNTDSGTILIFLPDYNHLVQLKTLILSSGEEIFDKVNRYQIYLLHSWMMIQDLNSLLSNATNNFRKIILSTSIGESSLNIANISFVIDSGIETQKVYDDILEETTLKTVYISKIQAIHRASRATNQLNRFCFHLYTLAQYQAFDDYKEPEILTHPLNEIILQMKLLTPFGVPINQFLGSMMDCPITESSKSSIRLLKSIGALDHFDELTELGYHLYDLPLDPKYGKMVLSSVLLKCLDPILTISCILNLQDPFVDAPSGSKFRELIEIKKKFSSNTFSDHMVLLRAFQFWQKSRAEGWENTFCQKNFLSAAVFEIITGIRTQLLGQLRASGFVKARGNGDIRDLNYNSENWAIVKAAIVSGLPNKFLLYDPNHSVLVGNMNAKAVPHPTSTLYSSETSSSLCQCNYSTNVFIYDKSITSSNASNLDWNEYDCLMTSNKLVQVKCVTMVTPATVALLGQNINIVQSESENQDTAKEISRERINVGFDNVQDNSDEERINIEFKADDELCQLFLKLRQKWQFLVMRKLKNPAKQSTPQDEAILRTIVNVLTLEEQSYGLKQPYGVGARPRPMAPEYCNQTDTCPDYCKPNMTNDTIVSEYSRNLILNEKRVPVVQIDSNAVSNIEVMKTTIMDQKELWNSSLIPMDKSKLLNSGTNHFFIIKLLHESEMCGILTSQVYKVNTSLKLQIEHLLFKGFTVYFIFINGSNSVLLGYARIIQVIYSDSSDPQNPLSNTDSPNSITNQTFTLSLDVYPGKMENNAQSINTTPMSNAGPGIIGDHTSKQNKDAELGMSSDVKPNISSANDRLAENVDNLLFVPQFIQSTKVFN